MKTKTTMLLALLLALVCTAAYAQEYYTLPEIREQAAQGWHETYTDKYGRLVTLGSHSSPLTTCVVCIRWSSTT